MQPLRSLICEILNGMLMDSGSCSLVRYEVVFEIPRTVAGGIQRCS